MLKLKLHNIENDSMTFAQFIKNQELLAQVGIIVADNLDSYDVTLLGYKSLHKYDYDTYQEGIEKTLELIDTIDTPIWIWDTDDSASLVGVYELLDHPKVKYVFKQFLRTKESYKDGGIFGRHFWKEDGHKYNFSFDLTDEQYSKLKLMGSNHGHRLCRDLAGFRELFTQSWDINKIIQQKNINNPKIDTLNVSAMMQINHKGRKFNKCDVGKIYTDYRKDVCNKVLSMTNKNDITAAVGHLPYGLTTPMLTYSSMTVSPAGMGASNFRDFEALGYYNLVIKSEMRDIITYPNINKNGYIIHCKPDYSDLVEIVSDVMDNYNDYFERLIEDRKLFIDLYSDKNWVRYFVELLNEEIL